MRLRTIRRTGSTVAQRGFNLVEVIIAMALLGTVLLGIMSLFFFGRSNVYSGKQMTHAVSVGTHVLEDLSGMSYTQIESAFDFEIGTDALASHTVNGVTFANALRRTTDDVDGDGLITDDDIPNFLDTWKEEVDAKLSEGAVDLIFTPAADDRVLRIDVVVSWNQPGRISVGGKKRQIIMETAKIRH